MKKCDEIKDLVLTDFIDGQLDKSIAGEVEVHLLDCGDCRAFLKEVKTRSVLPFQPAQPVPAELWEKIRHNIEAQEEPQPDPLAEFLEKLKGLMAFPKAVAVFASLMVMFLAGSMTLNTIQTSQAKDKEQGEYLVSMLSPTDASADNNEGGTSIEHYFL